MMVMLMLTMMVMLMVTIANHIVSTRRCKPGQYCQSDHERWWRWCWQWQLPTMLFLQDVAHLGWREWRCLKMRFDQVQIDFDQSCSRILLKERRSSVVHLPPHQACQRSNMMTLMITFWWSTNDGRLFAHYLHVQAHLQMVEEYLLIFCTGQSASQDENRPA